eukprot:198812_1
MEDLSNNVGEWSCRDVRKWLNKNRFGYSIMNRLFSQNIDGEALKLMRPKDVDKLLYDFTDYDKSKIKHAICTVTDKDPNLWHHISKNESVDTEAVKYSVQSVNVMQIAIANPSILPNLEPNQAVVSNSHNSEIKSETTAIDMDLDEEKTTQNADNKDTSNQYKRYSNDNKHDISNHGKRWNENDLELMWGLHTKGYSNTKIAEHFHRTECGIMVQIDKRYKDLRAEKDMKEIVDLRHKRIEQLRNGIALDEETDDSSSDDEPIMNKINRQR